MSVGINAALLRQKPDRLLIEPTGLGHPKQVIATLTSEQYTPYVDLKATLGLVDPRNLSIEKYTSNQNFNDQLDSADVINGTKVDLVHSEDIDAFNDWVTDQTPAKVFHKLIHDGEVPLEVLDIERVHGSASSHIESHHHDHAEQEPQFQLPPGEALSVKRIKGRATLVVAGCLALNISSTSMRYSPYVIGSNG